ncbi:hypothetical protein N7491_002030 [Penicillium cf. griseofulvum]|uniref:Uncharacterized protein n=1 Tax=Penicillium cf. griseofulvum TaxID=2972120 RepID=A0A9W9MTY1_9EURO|nr:hypothetical protein N7472_003785 [Penicillium cf. griseofulvum]KAJ5445948.1 hypothetical protein N7491_002030 [Penicillium cf. griseofulvum]KAJ5447671.1 hypothetical protein N7445_002492 [Penicillium cf. griseofulvum]
MSDGVQRTKINDLLSISTENTSSQMGNSTPIEPAPAYEDLFHQPGSSSRNGYAMVDQTDAEHQDVEQGHGHGHHLHIVPEVTNDEPGQHTHCAECDRQRQHRENQENGQRACAMVAKTFIFISLFLMILGIVGVQAWKDVRMKKMHG